jgi:YgiT-type zinc finger domain-containing protein
MSQTPKSGLSTENGSNGFKCHACGGDSAKTEFVSEIFTLEERHVLVEHIPAQVCERCGEPVFSRETTERIRRLVHDAQPDRTVPLGVFALA